LVSNAVRLWIHALAHNLANLMRTLALLEAVKHCSLTSLREKLIKIGAKVVRHGRYVILQMGEVAVPRELFGEISGADRRAATKTDPSVETGTVECVITIGGTCQNTKKKRPNRPLRNCFAGGQHAGSVPDGAFGSTYPSSMLWFTLIHGHLENADGCVFRID